MQIFLYCLATVFFLISIGIVYYLVTRGDDPLDPLTEGEKLLLKNFVKEESQYIASLQLPDGAIPNNYVIKGVGSQEIPYFSLLSVLGYIESKSNASVVTKFFDWYINHINTTPDIDGLVGTIYDYFYTTEGYGEYNSTCSYHYDSVDSYAALFLVAMKKYVQVYNDYSYPRLHNESIILVSSVLINETVMNDGLTYAKPSYKIKYLMDNCEVYQGLLAASWLFSYVLGDHGKSIYFSQLANIVSSKIETLMYDTSKSLYKYYTGATSINLSVFYPEATAQLFPISLDLISNTSSRAGHLFVQFKLFHSDWNDLTTERFPWAWNVLAAAKLGSVTDAMKWFNSAKRVYIDTNRTNARWYNAEAGLSILASKELLQMCGQ